jgi:hypothetical protein
MNSSNTKYESAEVGGCSQNFKKIFTEDKDLPCELICPHGMLFFLIDLFKLIQLFAGFELQLRL